MQLSPEQKNLHERALALCIQHRRVEAALVQVLRAIDKTKLYRKLGQPSLFMYAVNVLGLSESTAYAFITVARKSNEVAPLLDAIETQKLSVAKASRMVSVLIQDNAAELIEFACNHSTRELEFEVAKIRPRAQSPDRVKPLSSDMMKLEMCVGREVYAKLERAQALISSKIGKPAGFEAVLDAVLSDFIQRHDPVKKADRAVAKKVAKEVNHNDRPAKSASELCAFRAIEQKLSVRKRAKVEPRARQPLTAAQKHAVFVRDGGKCTHIDSTGKRCGADRWLHLHHLTPVSLGGGNQPENLTTLCSFHHDLAHQLSLPIDGQVTWLRDRGVRYTALA